MAALVLSSVKQEALYNGDDMCWAAQDGDEDLVLKCMSEGVSIETTTRDGWTPLLAAAYHGRLAVSKLLVNARANMDVQSTYGRTPIMCAVVGGHTDIVDLLRRAGANTQLKDATGSTALSFARLRSDEDIIKALEVKQAEPQRTPEFSEFGTPIMHASQWRQVDKLRKLLLVTGANSSVNDANSLGETALMHATKDAEAVRLLLDHGADFEATNIVGWTPLMFAAMYGQPESAALLLGASADAYRTSLDGRSALDFAREHDHHRQVVALLEQKTASDAAEAAHEARRARHLAAEEAAEAERERMRALQAKVTAAREEMLSKSIVTGSFDASQGSALFDAARDGDVEVLEACIFGGMEIDFRDGAGSTPLLAAAINGHDSAVKALVNARQRQVRLDATVNARTRNGWSALLWAAYYGHHAAVQVLVDARADLSTTVEGRSAIDLARGVMSSAAHAKTVQVLSTALAHLEQEKEKEKMRQLFTVPVHLKTWARRRTVQNLLVDGAAG